MIVAVLSFGIGVVIELIQLGLSRESSLLDIA